MAKKKVLPRGATPLAIKEKKTWSVTLPDISWQWLLLPVVFLGLVAGTRWAYQSWPITGIEVSGRLSVLDAEDIAGKITWVKQESFFSLNPQDVYTQVITLPLVKRVIVRKRWPGTVQLILTEDLPMAILNGKALLSVSGSVSSIPENLNTSGLAQIDGDEAQAGIAVRYFRRIQQSIEQRELTIQRLTINRVGAVSVELSNGWNVDFGRQYFEERVERLGLLLAALPRNAVDSLDLRYGKGAAIHWRLMQEMG